MEEKTAGDESVSKEVHLKRNKNWYEGVVEPTPLYDLKSRC